MVHRAGPDILENRKSLDLQGPLEFAKYSSTIYGYSNQKFTLALSHEKEELLAYLCQLR